MAITHNYVSSKSDPVDTSVIGKTKWNDAHAITSIVPALVTVAFAAGSPNIDASLGNTFQLTLTGAATLTVSNSSNGQTINVIIIQDGTGGRTLAWPASFKGAMDIGGIAAAINAIATQSFCYNGTYWLATGSGTVN